MIPRLLFNTTEEIFLFFFLLLQMYLKLLFLFLLLESFFILALVDGLSLESVWQQVSRTLLSILADLSNAIVWIVSSRPLFSKSSRSCTNPFMTVPRVTITIGIIVTFMFHSFFQWPSKVEVFILLFTFFHFYSVVSQDSKVHNSARPFLLFVVVLAFCFFFFFFVDYN